MRFEVAKIAVRFPSPGQVGQTSQAQGIAQRGPSNLFRALLNGHLANIIDKRETTKERKIMSLLIAELRRRRHVPRGPDLATARAISTAKITPMALSSQPPYGWVSMCGPSTALHRRQDYDQSHCRHRRWSQLNRRLPYGPSNRRDCISMSEKSLYTSLSSPKGSQGAQVRHQAIRIYLNKTYLSERSRTST